MSIDTAAAELRRALACLPVRPLTQAAAFFEEARTLLATASSGTGRPEAPAAIHLLDTTITRIAQLHHTTNEVTRLVQQYLAHIAADGQVSVAAPAQARTTPHPPPALTATSPAPPRSGVDPELVAEVQRQGEKINPERVVSIGKDRAGKVVWLEEGNLRTGLGHLLKPGRVDEFAAAGIDEAEIAAVVVKAATSGEPVGISGRDRVVFAINHRGTRKMIAVTVADNGYIVGGHPITSMKKVKPLT